MKIEMLSRKEIIERIARRSFRNSVIISFYKSGHRQVDLSEAEAEAVSIEIRFGKNGKINYEKFLPKANDAAKLIILAVAEGKNIVCQCDDGKTYSAGCAAAIWEFFRGMGIAVFSDCEKTPDKATYYRMFSALCDMQFEFDDIDDIDVYSLRTGRAKFDRREMIHRLFDLLENDRDNEIGAFGYYIVTKDRTFYCIEGMPEEYPKKMFLKDHTVDDILYIGINRYNVRNDPEYSYDLDSETGIVHNRRYNSELDYSQNGGIGDFDYMLNIMNKYNVATEVLYD